MSKRAGKNPTNLATPQKPPSAAKRPDARASDVSFRGMTVALAVALVALVVVCYWPAYRADFVDFDDSMYVYDNDHIATGIHATSLKWALTQYHASNWHPLTWVSHMLDIEMFGLAPAGHHMVNVALHAIDVLLLFGMLRWMTGRTASSFAVAMLFAIHPINVESVAWVSQRKTTLSTMFAILSIWSYACYARHVGPRRRAWRFYGLSLVCFALSLLSKQMMVTMPFALLLLDYWPLERTELATPPEQLPTIGSLIRGWLRLFPEKLPYLALALGASAVTVLVQHQALNSIESYPPLVRIGNVIIAYFNYLGLAIWPMKLAVFYPLYVNDIRLERVIGPLIVLLLLSVLCFWWGRRRRYVLVGWFWYLGTMAPVIGLIQVGAQSMADRYAYIPFWGLWLIFVWGMGDLLRAYQSRPAARLALAGGLTALAVALGWLTFAQADKWRDTIRLFEDAAADVDRNWLAHRELAKHYYEQHDLPRALQHSDAARACNKDMSTVLGTYGLTLFEAGRRPEAIDAFKQAISADPSKAISYTNLGWAYGELGDYSAALSQFALAEKNLKPADFDYSRGSTYGNWANALVKLNRLAEAADKYDQALKYQPDAEFLLSDAAEVDLRLNRVDRALGRLRRVSQLQPRDPRAALLLGKALAAKGDLAGAEAEFRRAIMLGPQLFDAQLQLSTVLARMQRYSDAAACLEPALKAANQSSAPSAQVLASTIYTQLGDIAAAEDQSSRAVEHYQSALARWPDNYPANNNLAWLLATHADKSLRDPGRAVELAKHACQLLPRPDATALGTLAAAYAAHEQMSEAVHTAREALALARKSNDAAATKAIEGQLHAYEQGQPFIEH